MKKNYNFNYVFVFYDVGEEICQKVFKVCKKYLNHFQLSVFRGKITPSLLIKLKDDLSNVIDKKSDSVVMIKLISNNYFEEDSLGKKKEVDNNLFV